MRIIARNVTVRYPRQDSPALDDVSLEVAPGSFYAVLGPNGSGKSTLMRAILGTVPRDSGEIELDDRPLADWDRRSLARAVGAVGQRESVAFPITVREFVAMGRYPHLGPLRAERDEDRRAIHDALERCDTARLSHREVGTLSGGEFQRVRLARALAQSPRALILDEPTASLDIRHEMEILSLLRKSADSGMTVLLITHHINLAARFADRLLLMSCGQVAAEGPAETVFDGRTLERVYGWPVTVRPDPETGAPRVTPR